MKVVAAGDRALLADFGESIDARTLHQAAAAVRALDGVLACIVAQRSLYVVFDREPDAGRLRDVIQHGGDELRPATRTHSIEVSFAREHALDLEEFLARHSLQREEFLRRVADLRLTARYLGFRAGFAYLDGWPPEWSMPRRPTSRPAVPRGSFAIANDVAGFYPIDSPGGWNVLGRTAAVLWDARRDPPNTIGAGDEIRIVPVETVVAPPPIVSSMVPAVEGAEILRNAQFASAVARQDWSRIDQGLPPGGAFDPELAAALNAAVGNDPGAPLLECALVGPRLRFRRRRVVIWGGARCSLPRWEPRVVQAGEELDLGPIRGGMRGWLAIGERAAPAPPLHRDRVREIRCMAGPHEMRPGSVECVVTPHLDRIGIRLRPAVPLPIAAPPDLPSCGMQFGTVQLHPDGTLVVMGPDHPVTGGYLQVMTIRWDERWKSGHLAPGDRVVLTTD